MALILPTKSLALVAIVAWSGIAASVLTGQREAAPQAVSVVPAHFEQRWGEVAADNESVLKKQDRLPDPVVHTPRHVEPAPLLEPATAEDVMQADEEKTKPKRAERAARLKHAAREEREERHVERNVCTRHGMRKVTTRHGKSWRCRK
jgi:hypothetical protein